MNVCFKGHIRRVDDFMALSSKIKALLPDHGIMGRMCRYINIEFLAFFLRIVIVVKWQMSFMLSPFPSFFGTYLSRTCLFGVEQFVLA